jgi:UDP-glucose 4-epimerase
VENLADLLAWCAESERSVRQVLPGVDAQAVSTTTLLRAAANAQGFTPRLFSMPDPVLALLAHVAGRKEEWRRLAGSFEVETAPLRDMGWKPPFSFEESFRLSTGPVALTSSEHR